MEEFKTVISKNNLCTLYTISNIDRTGSGVLGIYTDDKLTGVIYNVFVKEENRRLGLGSNILVQLEQLALTHNLINLYLKVKRNTFMHNWYIKLGYSYLRKDKNKQFVWLVKNLK